MKTIKFELPEAMVQVIGNLLDQAPYAMVAAIVAEMKKQIEAQRVPAPTPPE